MKSAHDLVVAARARVKEVGVPDAAQAIRPVARPEFLTILGQSNNDEGAAERVGHVSTVVP